MRSKADKIRQQIYLQIEDITFLPFADSEKVQMCKIINRKLSSLINSSLFTVSEHAKNMKSAIVIELLEMNSNASGLKRGKKRVNGFSYKDATNAVNRVLGSPLKHPPMNTVLTSEGGGTYRYETKLRLEDVKEESCFSMHSIQEEERDRNIHHAISRLTAKEQEYVKLLYFYEYTQEEVAAMYGVKKHNVARVQATILEKLRGCLS